jgi:uncharacterized membrane protein
VSGPSRGMRRAVQFLMLVALAVGALAVPAAAQAKTLTVTDGDVSMRLAHDASLLVNERLTINYDGHFTASYRDVDVKPDEKITDVHVSEGSQKYRRGGCTTTGCIDKPGTFGTVSRPGGVRVVWHQGDFGPTRTFDLSYRVTNVVVAYNDILDIRWQPWGSQWDQPLPHLTASFSNPRLRPGDPAYRVWGYPREVQGTVVRGDGAATLTSTAIPAHQYVAMQVTVPRTPHEDVSGARVVHSDGLNKIVKEEQAKSDAYSHSWARLQRFLGTHTALVGGIAAAVSILLLLLFAFLAREKRTDTPRYLSGPPEQGTPPALAYALAEEGDDSNDTVLATLLDLVDRGYYVATPTTTDGEKQDLALAQPAAGKRPSVETLTVYEKETLEFFDQILTGAPVAMSEMKDKIPEHDAEWRARWETMTGALDSADEGVLSWDRNFVPAKYVVGVLALIFFAVLTLSYSRYYVNGYLPLGIGVPTLLIVWFFPHNRLRRLSLESRKRSAEWQAFARWTEDFPRLEDDPPATLKLWKQILVYGVAFGTADRMIKSGRIPAPVVTEASNNGYWSYYALNGSLASSSLDGSSFGSSFASQVSSSSGGGGGFSSGGGGFSGGGGGGGW